MGHELDASWNDKYFAQLDAVYMDPFVSRVFTEIKEFNNILANQYASPGDITEIVDELNAEWYLLLGQDAVVTGNLKFVSEYDDISEDPQPILGYYENQNVVFYGVHALPLSESHREGSQLTVNEDAALYQLRLGFMREGIDQDSGLLIMSGSAEVDDIISLEFDDMISPERARLWLEYFHSEIIDEIDVLMLNPSLEECEMVMRLKDFELDLSGENRDMAGISKMALGVYVASLFDFDSDMPYSIVASGDAWGFTEYGAVEAQTIEAATLAKVYKIIWQPGTEDEDTVVRPLLDVAFLGTDKDSDPLHLLVPLNIVEDFTSLRYDYFYGYTASGEESESKEE